MPLAVLCLCPVHFSRCGEWGLLSRCGAGLLAVVASLVAERGLQGVRTYLQLLERCVEDPETGLYMLQVVKKGETYVYIDEATKQALRSKTTKMHVGMFAQQVVSFWDLLSSPYFTEERKKELVQGSPQIPMLKS